MAFVYFLSLRSGNIQVGCAIDLEQRMKDHLRGAACHTTRNDPPVELLRLEPCADFSAARKREAQLKK
jgi:predicted GIY-YIG superfamily endonuclease